MDTWRFGYPSSQIDRGKGLDSDSYIACCRGDLRVRVDKVNPSRDSYLTILVLIAIFLSRAPVRPVVLDAQRDVVLACWII